MCIRDSTQKEREIHTRTHTQTHTGSETHRETETERQTETQREGSVTVMAGGARQAQIMGIFQTGFLREKKKKKNKKKRSTLPVLIHFYFVLCIRFL